MSRLQTPVRRNDNVLVTTGKDRGKRGRVLKVLPEKNRLIVEGVNLIKRHTKPNPSRQIKGGRGERMWEFLDRLMSVALPRVRDFRGVSPRGFDGRGNYTLGLKDQLLFPEIDYMKVDKARGMNISVVTTAKTDEESRKLLQLLGMPFRTS